ncbi:hypothetical protein CQA53_08700 [Helicobacter didelphidarum]|uniref:Uncharacterized protein n=1 Tax=Helicobacter didelphidarum TaxID=2040648 RepID=A0A3D8IDB7_9HELI|nr:hypothetical protein [Helicobacter didelphidarum]RDU63213.1 hypothetical protein CQA53_08700 [Helicobacter didelphidarum]
MQTMLEVFDDNYNKHLYLFDSYSTKVLGMDTMYISLNKDKNLMFFKMPIDSLIVEITNTPLIDKMFRHFSSKYSILKHIPPSDSTQILKLILESIQNNHELFAFLSLVRDKTPYGELFANNVMRD